MCGVVAILSSNPVSGDLFETLTALQHRGQDAAGIVTSDGQRVYSRTGRGLVRDVFSMESLSDLRGEMGIGHVRYPTAGGNTEAESQPFYVNSPFGIALGHNGNLTNAYELGEKVFKGDHRQIQTSSDSEIMLNVLAYELSTQIRSTGGEPRPGHIFNALEKVFERCEGAFAVTVLVVGVGIVAFRDKLGIRPLIFGSRKAGKSTDIAFTSESVALDVLGFEVERDVMPGEAIFVDVKGNVHSHQCARAERPHPCIFEFVYLARPDSIIDRISVYKTRLRMGEWLGRRFLERFPGHDVDVVMPIPDTSRTAALQMAHTIGVKYREGLIKNRYFDRTFIMPKQSVREYSVRHKLNAMELEFENKNVLLVDDSIVRGTTARQIVKRAREVGAKKVYLASAAPPIRYPNVYGIDIPSPSELVAVNRNAEEVCEKIGADFVHYQRLDDLIESVTTTNSAVDSFDTSVFDGNYITGGVTAQVLSRIDSERRDTNREPQTGSVLEFPKKTVRH